VSKESSFANTLVTCHVTRV